MVSESVWVDLDGVATLAGELRRHERRRHEVVMGRLRRGVSADLASALPRLREALYGGSSAEVLRVFDVLGVVLLSLFDRADEWYEQCADAELIDACELERVRQLPDGSHRIPPLTTDERRAA